VDIDELIEQVHRDSFPSFIAQAADRLRDLAGKDEDCTSAQIEAYHERKVLRASDEWYRCKEMSLAEWKERTKVVRWCTDRLHEFNRLVMELRMWPAFKEYLRLWKNCCPETSKDGAYVELYKAVCEQAEKNIERLQKSLLSGDHDQVTDMQLKEWQLKEWHKNWLDHLKRILDLAVVSMQKSAANGHKPWLGCAFEIWKFHLLDSLPG
jgi:hypothetical protein